jgi:hypothetical protein
MKSLFIQLLALIGLARGAMLGEAAVASIFRSLAQLDQADVQLADQWERVFERAAAETARAADISAERARFARMRSRLSALIE